MLLLDLPDELLFCIGESLMPSSSNEDAKIRDVNALTRTNKRLHSILNTYLYRVGPHCVADDDDRGSIFMYHLTCHNLTEVRSFLAAGADPNGRPVRDTIDHDFDPRPFRDNQPWFNFWAVTGSTKQVRRLNPLQKALRCSDLEMVKLLCEYDADCNVRFPPAMLRCSLLHQASAGGKIKIVTFLLDEGMDPNVCDDRGQTPLHYVAEESYKGWRFVEESLIKTAKVLIARGADPNFANHFGRTPKDILEARAKNIRRWVGWGTELHEDIS